MKVRFLQNAQAAGVAYRKGQVAELPDEAAKVYCRVHQAVAVNEPKPEPKVRPKRKTAKRAGKPAETASDAGGEKR